MCGEIPGLGRDDGVSQVGFKRRPYFVRIKGIIPVQFNKTACIIMAQFTS